jgi:cellulose biosynthesis protein BcsQ
MLSVAPARLALAKLEQQLAGQFDAPYKLKDALAPVVKDYDYIVIDTPPALGILTVNAMVASTHLLVPIQAAYFAIEGTDDLLETYERIRARPNPGLKVLGVVITLFDKRTNISRDTHEQIRSVFGAVLFKTRIGKNVRLEESPAYKETIMTFAPKSPGAKDYSILRAGGIPVFSRRGCRPEEALRPRPNARAVYDRHPDYCQSEGRRGKDNHRHQSCCRHRQSKQENAPDRPRPAG